MGSSATQTCIEKSAHLASCTKVTTKLFSVPKKTSVPPPEEHAATTQKLELIQRQTAMRVAHTLHVLILTMNKATVIWNLLPNIVDEEVLPW